MIVQGAHKVVGFDYGSAWQAIELRQSVLVVIGRDLPSDKIKEQFQQLFVEHH
ncbi:GTP-binding protein [Paenalcaligenes niemegkensis]|nr:GTP-binding protein [Paenalcaligenes niemegkensis]